MLNNDVFYFQTIKKITETFGYIFKDITIERIDPNTKSIKSIKVPVSQSAKEKWAVRMEEDLNAGDEPKQRHVQIVLPRMGFELTNLHYDSKRKLPSINYRVYPNPTGIGFVNVIHGGSGYNHVPILTFSSGEATCKANILNGSIVDVIITNAGTGYSWNTLPTIIITPTGGDTPTDATLQVVVGGPSALYQLNPVPYLFDYSLYLQTRTLDDSFAIIEQILAFFRPDYVVPIIDIPEMDLHRDIVFTLMNTSHTDSYQGTMLDKRIIEWQFDFQAQAFIYPPIKTKPVITTSTSYIEEIGDITGPHVIVAADPNTGNIDEPYNIVVTDINN
jgi:T4-like virus Myoviridae tail sheath stabiliser